jgi:anti-sigma-K factor RskA
MTLDEQLRALKDIESRVEAPQHLESTLLEAFDGQSSQVRGHRQGEGHSYGKEHRSGWRVIAALAAGVIVGVGLTVWQLERDAETPTLAAVPVSESVVLVLDPSGVEETVRVVRIRVARSALEGLGLQTVAVNGSDSVEVDVLVGEDGVARGVRLAM